VAREEKEDHTPYTVSLSLSNLRSLRWNKLTDENEGLEEKAKSERVMLTEPSVFAPQVELREDNREQKQCVDRAHRCAHRSALLKAAIIEFTCSLRN